MQRNPGAKNFVAQQNFSHEIVGTDEGALLREHVAGACCRSKLPRVYRPLTDDWAGMVGAVGKISAFQPPGFPVRFPALPRFEHCATIIPA